MSLSPSKHQRTLSRQPSSPSLAVGLPPDIPDNTKLIMSPSSPSKVRVKRDRIHRGDVESSGDSSSDEWVLPTTPSMEAGLSLSNTPKRKVVNTIEPIKTTAKKRDTLQARLASAARVKKSKSAGDGLSMAVQNQAGMSSTGSLIGLGNASSGFLPLVKERISLGKEDREKANDKVIVCVRIKPTRSAFAAVAYDVAPRSLTLADGHPNVQRRGGKAGREDEYTYNFDALLQYPSKTSELYKDKVAPLVEKAMNGFNSTIFAYGQTGSGKSFTMTGQASELGIIPCAVDGVFDAITADTERAFLLRVSYIEIYNETLRDLLNPKKGPLKDDEKPSIHSTSKGKVWVEPLVEEVVSTPQEVVDLLERGNACRKVGATDWNERSSRSHSVFTIVVESRPRDGNGEDDVRLSRLNLIDLAGSEKAVSDMERRGEGKHINQSLLALREVINKLTEKKKATHIPYRNSKLTHLLENALGGDSNICVICTLSVEEEHTAETLETLKFAGRCSQVETKAKKNVLMSTERALIRAKDQEIEELRRKLQSINRSPESNENNDQVMELADSVADLEARKSKLMSQLAKLNGEILTSELPRSGSALLVSPARQKRRRISDFASLMGGGRLGMGSPKMRISDRRAVSGMVRLGEDDMPSLGEIVEEGLPASKSFDKEREIASLRRELAAKESELLELTDKRNNQICMLESELAELRESSRLDVASKDGALQDLHAQLETTRSELVRTIEDKSGKIDELETAILDLRKSREDLVIEDQTRYEELQKERDNIRAKLDAELSSSRALEESSSKEMENLREQNSARQRDLEKARADLDDFQKAAMSTQDSTITELRDELAKVRGTSEKVSKAKETMSQQLSKEIVEKEEMRASMESERRRALAAERGLSAFQEASIGNEAATQKIRMEMEEFKRKFEDAERSRLDLQRQLDEEKSLRSADTEKLRAVQDDRAKVEEMLKAGEETIAGLQADVATNKELVVTLQNVVQEKDSRVSQLDSELGDLRAQRDASPTSEEVDRLRDQIVTKDTMLADLDRQVKVAEDHAKSLESDITFLRSDKAALIEEVDMLKASAAEFVRQTAIHEDRNKSLVDQVSALETAKVALSDELERSKAASVEDKEAIQEAEEHSRNLESQLKALEAEKRTLGDQLEQLQSSMGDASAVLAEQLRTAQESLARSQDHSKNQENLVKSLQKEVDDLQNKLSDAPTSTEMSLLKTALDAAQDASEQAHRECSTASRERQAAMDAVLTLQNEIEGLKTTLKSSPTGEDVDQLREQLTVVSKELEAARADIVEAEKARADLQRLHDVVQSELALRPTSKDLADVESKLKSTTESLSKQKEEISRLITAVDEGKVELAKMSDEKASAMKQLEAMKGELKALEASRASLPSAADLEKIKSALHVARDELSSSKTRIEDLSTKLTASNADVEKLKAANAGLPKQSKVEDLQRQLVAAQDGRKALEKQVEELKLKVTALGKELLEAQSTVPPLPTSKSARLRHTSTPSPFAEGSAGLSGLPGLSDNSRAGPSSLRTASAGDDVGQRTRSKETEEIERLEKVIESQKIMIDDQREKIKFWARELEQQRDIVRKLTEAPQGSPTASPGSKHTKSKSLALPSPSRDSPSPASGFSNSKKSGLSSTFTAHNLALPSSGLTLMDASPKPKPLPSHPSQWSNTGRKARRATIEHDMDSLSESSKVLQAKKIFDSPTTTLRGSQHPSLAKRKA